MRIDCLVIEVHEDMFVRNDNWADNISEFAIAMAENEMDEAPGPVEWKAFLLPPHGTMQEVRVTRYSGMKQLASC